MNRHILFAALAVFAISNESNALEVFGNGDLGSTANTGGFTFNANNAWAVPFTTGATTGGNLELSGATVLTGGVTSNVTFTVAIYADSGTNGGPTGSAIASGTLSLNNGDPIAWNTVSFSSSITLTTSTNYYLAVEESTSLTGFNWVAPTVSPAYSDLGSGSSYAITPVVTDPQNVWRRSGTTWFDGLDSVNSNRLGLRLVAVPEPSTYALAGIAALALGIVVRRKKPVSA